MQNIIQTSQDLERKISQNSSRETQAQKVSYSMGSTLAHPEQNMKASRVAMSHQLIELLQHCHATDFANFLTGNESWFFLESPHHGVWAACRDELPETRITKIDTESA
jgi:hypothetical protein